MSFGGKKTQTTMQSSDVPAYITDNHQNNINTANSLAAQPYADYGGQRLANQNQTQADALSAVEQNIGVWRPYTTAAIGMTDAAANHDPAMVSAGQVSPQFIDPASVNRGGIRDVNDAPVNRGDIGNVGAHAINRGDIANVTAGLLTNTNLSAYINPHTDSVVNAAVADVERSGAAADQAMRARYAAAGAFGGSRGAVAQGENARNTQEVVAKTTADLRQRGYDGAVTAATADINRQFAAAQGNQGVDWNTAAANQAAAQTADRANQATDLSVQQGNQAASMQAQITNQGMDWNAANANANLLQGTRQFNANLGFQVDAGNADRSLRADMSNQTASSQSAALSLDAARVMAGLGASASQLGQADAQALYGAGAAQRADEQAGLDVAYQDWMAQQQYPLQMLQLQQSVLSGAPYSQTVTSAQPVYRNTGANALSGALGGAQLAKALGVGPEWGAGAGALAGLLG